MSIREIKEALEAAQADALDGGVILHTTEQHVAEAANSLEAAQKHFTRALHYLLVGKARLGKATRGVEQGSGSIEQAVWGAASCLEGTTNEHARKVPEEYWAALMKGHDALAQLDLCGKAAGTLIRHTEAIQFMLGENLPLLTGPDCAAECLTAAVAKTDVGIEETDTYMQGL